MALEQSTKFKAIKEAKSLLQRFGFNGFSFQHIANSIGIKKPSLYAHFESKEALGNDLIDSYINSFNKWTTTIEIFDPTEKIKALFELYFKFSIDDKKLCPVTSLTGDYNSLPVTMTQSLNKMVIIQKNWIKKVIEEGQNKNVFRKDLSSETLSDIVMALSFGSQQLARAFNDSEKIHSIKLEVLKILKG